MSMATTRRRKQSRSRPRQVLQKPRGVIHPRVQQVGPEHFGIVSVDGAKARSKWMLCDFYGNILVPPTLVEHNRAALDAAVVHIRQAMQQHALQDLLVAVERTGRYHRPVQPGREADRPASPRARGAPRTPGPRGPPGRARMRAPVLSRQITCPPLTPSPFVSRLPLP